MENIEHIAGSVERVTFHSEESGFCVLRTKVKGKRALVTIVGNAATISAGEFVKASGIWFNDRNHGLQFKAQQLKTVPPTTLEGIEKYLGSGMVKGIGPHFAKTLVAAFGEDVFTVIEETPGKLLSLPGIGAKRKDRITSAWSEQKMVREIMVFLQSHGVGTARAVRIYKTYGDSAIDKVRDNPYRLALDIHGIGFKTADQLAQKLGIPNDSLMRASAGVRHVLQEHSGNGHCAAFSENLCGAAVKLLDIPKPIILNAIQDEIQAERIIQENIDDQPALFLAPLYQAEKSVAKQLAQLNQDALPWGPIDANKAIPWAETKTQITLSNSQQQAVENALTHKVMIITGGPGVGKTTIVNTFLKIVMAKGISVALAAPTGRAAKRLSETTGITAKTIHRLLDYEPQTHSFKYNLENPLPAQLVIVDEASMLDIVLINHLLKAISGTTALLLIGDVDQLPSVGPGAVLSDCIQSGVIKTVQLTEIFRQAQSSHIILNAHRINQGQMPLKSEETNTLRDFYFIAADTPEAIHEKLLEVVTTRIPKRFGFNPIQDIQILTPMNRGGLGTRSFNIALQAALNPNAEPKVTKYGTTYAPGDKVIQTVNNYDKEVFNGDIGWIRNIDLEASEMHIYFDGRVVTYDLNELDELSLAYAISIHKSQGSEYPAVVIPIAMQHYMMLARNLMYTGVTRGKQLVVIIGQYKALAMAVKNNQALKRITHLCQRLKTYSETLK